MIALVWSSSLLLHGSHKRGLTRLFIKSGTAAYGFHSWEDIQAPFHLQDLPRSNTAGSHTDGKHRRTYKGRKESPILHSHLSHTPCWLLWPAFLVNVWIPVSFIENVNNDQRREWFEVNTLIQSPIVFVLNNVGKWLFVCDYKYQFLSKTHIRISVGGYHTCLSRREQGFESPIRKENTFANANYLIMLFAFPFAQNYHALPIAC